MYLLSEDEATGRPISSMERKLRAFLNSPAAQPGQPSSGAVAPAGVYKGPNPGGPMIRCDIPNVRDEKSVTGDKSGDARDVVSRPGASSDPETGTKMDEEKEEVTGESASRVKENEKGEITEK